MTLGVTLHSSMSPNASAPPTGDQGHLVSQSQILSVLTGNKLKDKEEMEDEEEETVMEFTFQ